MTTLATWELGTCAKCDTDGYVILMRTRRLLCEGCFTITPERTYHSSPYLDEAAPVWHRRRTLTPKKNRKRKR